MAAIGAQVGNIQKQIDTLEGRFGGICAGKIEVNLQGVPGASKFAAQLTPKLRSEFGKSLKAVVKDGVIGYGFDEPLTKNQLAKIDAIVVETAKTGRVNLNDFSVDPKCVGTPGGLAYVSVSGQAKASTETQRKVTLSLKDLAAGSRLWFSFVPPGKIVEKFLTGLMTGKDGREVKGNTYSQSFSGTISGDVSPKPVTVYVMIGRAQEVTVAGKSKTLRVVQYRKFDIHQLAGAPKDKPIALADPTRQPACPPVEEPKVKAAFEGALKHWHGGKCM